MKCPLLIGNHNKICKAVGIILSPGPEEIESLCNTAEYQTCPIYNNYLVTGRKIGLRDFCLIKSRGADAAAADVSSLE